MFCHRFFLLENSSSFSSFFFPPVVNVNMQRTLIAVGNSADTAIPLLFEADRKRRASNNHQEKVALMRKAFAGLSPAIVQEIVERNDGDVELSSRELLAHMERQQAEMEKDLAVAQRARFVEHAKIKFDVLSTEEIEQGIGAELNVAEAVARLTELSNARKSRNLTAMFPRRDAEDVLAVLQSCGYDVEAACLRLLSSSEADDASPIVVDAAEQLNVTIRDAIQAMDQPDAATEAALQHLLRETLGPAVAAAAAAAVEEKPCERVPMVADQEEGLAISLETESRHFPQGSEVRCRVLASGGAISSYDWVTMATVDQPDEQYTTWQWSKPVLTFAPTHGVWELRYIRRLNGKAHVLARTSFTVGPKVSLNIDRTETQWDVTWTAGVDGEPVTDSAWMGLYERSAPHNAYLAFHYVHSTTRTASFKAPRQNGTYEVRFFASRFAMIARSEPITLQASDAIRVAVEGVKTLVDAVAVSQASCWVGIFHYNDDSHSRYRRYSWMTAPQETFSFKTPIHSGNYCARLYSRNNVLLAQSEMFTIQ